MKRIPTGLLVLTLLSAPAFAQTVTPKNGQDLDNFQDSSAPTQGSGLNTGSQHFGAPAGFAAPANLAAASQGFSPPQSLSAGQGFSAPQGAQASAPQNAGAGAAPRPPADNYGGHGGPPARSRYD